MLVTVLIQNTFCQRWMDVWMYGCMDVWMYGCMDVCM